MKVQRMVSAIMLGMLLFAALALARQGSSPLQRALAVPSTPSGIASRGGGCAFMPPHSEAPQPVVCLSPTQQTASGTPGVTGPCRFTPVGRSSPIPVMCPPPGHLGSLTLRMVTLSGHQFGIRGQGWLNSPRVVVQLREGGMVVRLALRPTGRGVFLIAADRVDLCGGILIVAHQPHHTSVTLRGPALMCPSRANPPVPVLKVVRGSLLQGPSVQR